MMIHGQLRNRLRIKGVASFAWAGLFSLLIGCPLRPASAGEVDRSTLPAAVADPARCYSGGGAPSLLKDAGDCKRISGYITAGARLGTDEEVGGRNSPFGPLEPPEFVGSVRPSGATVIDAPAGQDRFFRPPNLADEAR
jgi:hypothetical protein